VSVQGLLRRARVELSVRRGDPLPHGFVEPLAGRRGLELGGPSACFGRDAALPAYPALREIDGVQPTANTTWHQLDPEVGYVVDGERRGALHLIDDVDMPSLQADTYDAVICSHVIEHIANPLRALAAWRRVSRPEGYLLMVVPHMAATFDHRRSLTPLSHMIEDLDADTGEDDLTHLEEFLRLHDSDRNVRGIEDPDFVSELRDNARTRLLHHHTFTTSSLIELLGVAGLQVHMAQTRLPHDIYVLGRWVPEGQPAENLRFALTASRQSPFRADRRCARELARERE
jgi:SAM-dependent methyltransferase